MPAPDDAQPLMPHQIQDLPSIKWNYERGTIDDLPGLDPGAHAAISAALHDYVWNKAGNLDTARLAEPHVNAALRGSAEVTPQHAATIELLDQALVLSRINRPITVYRGFGDGRFALPDDWQTRDLTGLTWTDRAYISTSVDRDAAEVYTGGEAVRGFAARIHLPAGTPAIAIRDQPGGLDEEGEIMLPRGLGFRVTRDFGRQGEYGIRWLDLEIAAWPGALPE
ncbi:hypothetical protein J5X84_41165 [Streptosporangiaceae bacterium NEAU-GS5]|nr:hypothetical protein [Streptosporangiaceae bacterium NEAU-GS5]